MFANRRSVPIESQRNQAADQSNEPKQRGAPLIYIFVSNDAQKVWNFGGLGNNHIHPRLWYICVVKRTVDPPQSDLISVFAANAEAAVC